MKNKITEKTALYKGVRTMKKWLLTCSIDGIDIDYEEIIDSEDEPGFWDCENIAQEHDCELWSLEELKEI